MRTAAASGDVAVALKKPKDAKFELPQGVVFPTGQMKAIVEAARWRARASTNRQIYDGSDGGEKVYSTLAVIGRKIARRQAARGRRGRRKGARRRRSLARDDLLFRSRARRRAASRRPVYSISFELYANGISGNIRLDYNDFTLKGEMTSLEFLPKTQCRLSVSLRALSLSKAARV